MNEKKHKIRRSLEVLPDSDCKLAAQVNRILWRWARLDYLRLVGKLNQAGYSTAITPCATPQEFFWIMGEFAGPASVATKEFIFGIPLELNRSSSRYRECVARRKLARSSNVINFGMLREYDEGRVPQLLMGYVVFRVRKTNTCIVQIITYNHFEYLERKENGSRLHHRNDRGEKDSV